MGQCLEVPDQRVGLHVAEHVGHHGRDVQHAQVLHRTNDMVELARYGLAAMQVKVLEVDQFADRTQGTRDRDASLEG